MSLHRIQNAGIVQDALCKVWSHQTCFSNQSNNSSQNRRVLCVGLCGLVMMNEQWRSLSADSEEFSETSVACISFFLSGHRSGCTYLPACSNDGWAKCMRVSLWQWHETGKKTKRVGTNKQTNKTKKEKKKKKGSQMYRNVTWHTST